MLDAIDVPVLHDGPAGRRAVNSPLLAEIVAKSQASKANVELFGVRPGEGACAHSRSDAPGASWRAFWARWGISATQITPASWKRTVGFPAGRDGAKGASRSEVIRRWPRQAELFARVKDDGRAEAALVSVAGLKREAMVRRIWKR